MKPERLTNAPENAGKHPNTIKMKKWYLEPTREDDDPHFPSSSRASDVFTGTKRTSCQVREPIENDEERLAMKKVDMPLPEQVANLSIRKDRAVQENQSSSDKMHRATSDDAFTQAWFDYCRTVFPQSVRKTGTNVDIYSVSMCQCSILVNNMGSFNWKSVFRKAENLNKPTTKSEKFNVADFSLVRDSCGNNYALVILTAEAGSLSTDAKQLLEDYGLVGCHSSRGNDLSVHARIDFTGCVRLLWESTEEDDENGHAAIFEVKFGKKAEGVTAELREGTAESLFDNLESVELAVEGSDLGTTEDNFVPTARCIQDTKERQLVTRSGLQRLRCCVCHLHHERAMNAPYHDRQFFKTVLQQVYHFEVDVIAGDANAAAYKYYKKQEYQDLHKSSFCRYVERHAT